MTMLMKSSGVWRAYAVRKRLSMPERKSVALGIYLDLSYAFEQYQTRWPTSYIPIPSGFSVEDLMSNVIAFYRALVSSDEKDDYIARCEPVSKEKALWVWDTYAPNYGLWTGNVSGELRPYLYPLEKKGSPKYGRLPDFLNKVKPASAGKGGLYWRIPDSNLNRSFFRQIELEGRG